MKDGRHIIWSNDIDYDDWREDLEEQYPDLTEAERMALMYELNGDFRCDAIHHDGTNHYLYRAYKDGVSDTQIDNLKEKLYRGIATRADITRVTRRLGDEIAHVYGFPIPRRQAPVQER